MLIFINITLSSFLEKIIFKEITPRDDVFDSSIGKVDNVDSHHKAEKDQWREIS